jgi:vitamin B12 transporter
MHKILISTASVLALSIGATQAQQGGDREAATTLQAITVTANRTPTEMSQTGSTVEQVSEEQIEEQSLPLVRDYLNRLPGVSFTANGGLGTSSNLYIRGLAGRYVKTLYNGIDVSDVTGTQVQTQYQYLATGGVTGIEVLKGSQSTLYGSNAIAGVVDITTLGEIESGARHTVETEGGSFGTARGRYGFAAAKDGSKISGNISGVRTDGISALAGGSERDGYENVTLDLAAEHRINDAFSVFGSLFYIDAEAEFDGFQAPNDVVSYERAEMMGARAGYNLDLMDGRLKNTFSAQGFQSERDSVEGGNDSSYVGTRYKVDYQGSFEATDRILFQYGIDHERQHAETRAYGSGIDKSNHLTGLWAQTTLEPLDNLVLTAGLRHDQHSEFGGHATYRGTASYRFDATGTRIHSSLGTGFRAPSLYELFDPVNGNAGLEPETSESFDIGIEQSFIDGRLLAGISYFRLSVDDRIDFVRFNPDDEFDWSGRYEQTRGRSRSQGIELSFSYAATDWLDLGGSYTYTKAKDPDGRRASHVPEHMVALSATAKPAEKWTISGDLKFVADVVDSAGKLDDYVLLNAKVAYQVNESTEIYLRGENLLDQDYQVVRGYNTPGLAAYAGIKASF